jgi:hypothetical protein
MPVDKYVLIEKVEDVNFRVPFSAVIPSVSFGAQTSIEDGDPSLTLRMTAAGCGIHNHHPFIGSISIISC